MSKGFITRGTLLLGVLLGMLVLAGCGAANRRAPVPSLPPPTVPSLLGTSAAGETESAVSRATTTGEASRADAGTPRPSFVVYVDATNVVGEISPLVYGVSGATAEVLADLRPTLNSWGGNPNTRYNWRLGNAWNAASDWFFRNTDYGYDIEAMGMPAHENFIEEARAVEAATRLAVPTLGWVAKDSDGESCSFRLPNGSCGNPSGEANCKSNRPPADPELTSVRSTSDDIREWMETMAAGGYEPDFIAMDNEPELWGYTHYDVHPECTTYQEILDKYLEYATAVQEAMPGAELAGPVTCCWEYYWHSAAGSRDEARHGSVPFLPWFLDQVRAHDEARGERSLHILDIHFYPEGLYNDREDPETAARRLRSTRSLWDPHYVDESWIGDQIALIPRMQGIIAEHYPETRLGISEWNWGADETLNGALAVADVLGILGREDVYFAAYWRYPDPGSPAYRAFKLYSNYDGAGSRFVGKALALHSDEPSWVDGYAALAEDENVLRAILINKQPELERALQLILDNFAAEGPVSAYTLDADGTTERELTVGADGRVIVTLPPYSVTLLVVPGTTETAP